MKDQSGRSSPGMRTISFHNNRALCKEYFSLDFRKHIVENASQIIFYLELYTGRMLIRMKH